VGEAIVVPLRDSARDATRHWRTLLEAERDWSPGRSPRQVLPTFNEIMEQSTNDGAA
jgi:hypothetical protein